MTVEELINQLGEMPADAQVVLSVKNEDMARFVEAEDFTVELSDDGAVVLEA
jgi:hypothetical protein